jgi:K+ potassium transporter
MCAIVQVIVEAPRAVPVVDSFPSNTHMHTRSHACARAHTHAHAHTHTHTHTQSSFHLPAHTPTHPPTYMYRCTHTHTHTHNTHNTHPHILPVCHARKHAHMQASALGVFPKMHIIHTNSFVEGQIFIPFVNYTLMLLCIAVVAGFGGDNNKLGNAYGALVPLGKKCS